MGSKLRCPVCTAENLVDTVVRHELPVMQNVVFATQTEARSSPRAPFTLSVCQGCGFAFNRQFDASLLVYDSRYDNDVPSVVFADYYRTLARMLLDKLALPSGVAYDIGCGKGEFLRTLCGVAPTLTGVGIDPSCVAGTSGRVTLIRDVFSPAHFDRRAALVTCRHVLEHLDQPRDFVEALREAMAEWASAPLFVEVPNASWIWEVGAFWDFCYEHCNYFTPASLAATLRRAGLETFDEGLSFGRQYQWMLCRAAVRDSTPPDASIADRTVTTLRAYAQAEQSRIAQAKRLVAKASAEGPCVLWGMATKGVVFANLVDPEGTLIVGGVDINVKKQGRFIAGSGHEIHPPEWVCDLGGKPTVFVMNGNYAGEIRATLETLHVEARLEVL